MQTLLEDAPIVTASQAGRTLAEITSKLKRSNAAGAASRRAKEAADAVEARARRESAPQPATVEVEALGWATAICGRLWEVAPKDARDRAVELMNADYLGSTRITVEAAHTVKVLDAARLAAKAAKFAVIEPVAPALTPVVSLCPECGEDHDAEEESDPSTWPAWTDEVWTLAEDRHPAPVAPPKPKPQPPKGPKPQPRPARPFGAGVEPEASFADDLVVATSWPPAWLAPATGEDLGFTLAEVVAYDDEPVTLSPDRLSLDQYVDGVAAHFAGLEGGGAQLIAKTLAELARDVRFFGARSVHQYEDRRDAWQDAQEFERFAAAEKFGADSVRATLLR
jgi:hypothetical protein